MTQDNDGKITEAEAAAEAESNRKTPSQTSHNNFWALFYVWGVVLLFLVSASGAVYWFGIH